MEPHPNERQPDHRGPDRRRFLGAAALGAAAAGLAACSDDGDTTGGSSTTADSPTTGPATTSGPAPQLPGPPFTLGVASGDPLADSVILWTRLAPSEGRMPDQPVEVLWEVATDDSFGELVASGVATAEPQYDHSVHVDATGLQPATSYHYRFTVGDQVSPAGRTLTTASEGDAPVNLAVTTCQGFVAGYYTAYRHIAEEQLDAVLFTGDFIYDFESGDVRPTGLGPPVTLEDYRNLYSIGLADADLALARAAHPWIVTWDDHEVEDNYAGLTQGELGKRANTNLPEGFEGKRAAAYQAWWENQPVRAEPPEGPDLTIYRSFRFGDTASLAVLDNRQYRDPQAIDETYEGIDQILMYGRITEGAKDPERVYLGTEQADWLIQELTTSDATWKVIGQQSVMGGWNLRPDLPEGRWSMDTWDGYQAERQRVLDTIADEGIENVVTVGGDIHSAIVQEVRLDPTDPSPDAEIVASEFITPSISSLPSETEADAQLMATAPYVEFYDVVNRGYMVMTFTSDDASAAFTWVDATVPDAPAQDGPVFRVEKGNPDITEVD